MRSIPIEDLIEYRQLTEIAVVGWAAQRRDEKNLKDMECCIQRASDILDRDPVRFFAEDVNFHNIICEASGNQLAPILGKTLHNLVGEVLMTGFNNRDSAGQLAMCDQIVSVHRMIYEAIAARDVEQSQNVMRIHLNNFSLTRRYFPEKRESN